MPSRRDAIDDAFERAGAAIDATLGTTLDVYQPTETTTHTGRDVDYPDSPTTGADAHVTSPSEDSDVQASGTDTDLDAVAYVAGDSGVTWTAYDTPGDAATEVEDTRTGDRYRVETVVTSHGDRLQLGLVGSDAQ